MDGLKKLTEKIKTFYTLAETHDSQVQEWIKESKKPIHSLTNQSAILRAVLPEDSILNTPFERFEGFRETLIDNITTALEEEVIIIQVIRDKIDAANEILHKEQKSLESLYSDLKSKKTIDTSGLNPSSPSFEHIIEWCHNIWCCYHSFYLQISQALTQLNYSDEATIIALSESFKENPELKRHLSKIRSFDLQNFQFLT